MKTGARDEVRVIDLNLNHQPTQARPPRDEYHLPWHPGETTRNAIRPRCSGLVSRADGAVFCAGRIEQLWTRGITAAKGGGGGSRSITEY